MVEKSQIEALFVKSFTNELTNEEQVLLKEWLAEEPEHQKEYEACCEIWQKSKSLILSDTINIETSLLKTKQRIPEFNRKHKWLRYSRQVAAVLATAILLNISYNYLSGKWNKDQSATVYQEIKSAYGTFTKLELPDGTQAWLNSGSSLRFPASFKNMDIRKVELCGEAYFEVTKDAKHPFIVNTEKLDVKVLGTSFDVSAYKGYPTVTVALLEGKVSILKNIGKESKEIIALNPMEVADYNISENRLFHSKKSYMDKYYAWKEGRIVFEDDPLETLVKRLENWYNVDIVVKDEHLKNSHFTATFANEPIEEVLRLLSISTNFSYQITPAMPNTDGTYGKKKVLLTNK